MPATIYRDLARFGLPFITPDDESFPSLVEDIQRRALVPRDRLSFILPGSKRLITQEGMLGDNSDVLPPQTAGGVISGKGGRRRGAEADLQQIEMQLDTVLLEDGLCVGPDESGLFESVTSGPEAQRRLAGETAAALRSGASAGELFEKLRPLARHPRPDPTAGREMKQQVASPTALHASTQSRPPGPAC